MHKNTQHSSNPFHSSYEFWKRAPTSSNLGDQRLLLLRAVYKQEKLKAPWSNEFSTLFCRNKNVYYLPPILFFYFVLMYEVLQMFSQCDIFACRYSSRRTLKRMKTTFKVFAIVTFKRGEAGVEERGAGSWAGFSTGFLIRSNPSVSASYASDVVQRHNIRLLYLLFS